MSSTHRKHLARRLADASGLTYQQSLNKVIEAAKSGLLPPVLDGTGTEAALRFLVGHDIAPIKRTGPYSDEFPRERFVHLGDDADARPVHASLRQSSLIVGPSGRGKTVLANHIARHAVSLGYHLHIVDVAKGAAEYRDVIAQASVSRIATDLHDARAVLSAASSEIRTRDRWPDEPAPPVLMIVDDWKSITSDSWYTGARDDWPDYLSHHEPISFRREMSQDLRIIAGAGPQAGITLLLLTQQVDDELPGETVYKFGNRFQCGPVTRSVARDFLRDAHGSSEPEQFEILFEDADIEHRVFRVAL